MYQDFRPYLFWIHILEWTDTDLFGWKLGVAIFHSHKIHYSSSLHLFLGGGDIWCMVIKYLQTGESCHTPVLSPGQIYTQFPVWDLFSSRQTGLSEFHTVYLMLHVPWSGHKWYLRSRWKFYPSKSDWLIGLQILCVDQSGLLSVLQLVSWMFTFDT